MEKKSHQLDSMELLHCFEKKVNPLFEQQRKNKAKLGLFLCGQHNPGKIQGCINSRSETIIIVKILFWVPTKPPDKTSCCITPDITAATEELMGGQLAFQTCVLIFLLSYLQSYLHQGVFYEEDLRFVNEVWLSQKVEGKINVAGLWRSAHLYLLQRRKECSQNQKELEFRRLNTKVLLPRSF